MNRQSYKKSDDIRRHLLDTAEQLFAEMGYHGTSVRDITEKTGARLASINYHFESKENLFFEVIRRRLHPLCQARRKKLKAVTINVNKPRETVYAIVSAFAGPMIEYCSNGEAGWRYYCMLIAQLSAQPEWSSEVVGKEYDPVAKEFIAALSQLFPELDEYHIHCCFQFMLGSTLYVVCDNKRIDRLSGGRFRSDEIQRMSKPFYDYTTGGIIATVDSNGYLEG